jgi:small subunit ribosomal protein S18
MGKFKRFGNGQRGQLKVAVRSSNGVNYVDYRNIDTLRKFTSPNGKILTRKRTGLNAYEQRMVANAIKRARYIALLPYTSATL